MITWTAEIGSDDYFEAHANGGQVGDGVTLVVTTIGPSKWATFMNGKRANCAATYDSADEAKDALVIWAQNRIKSTLQELNYTPVRAKAVRSEGTGEPVRVKARVTGISATGDYRVVEILTKSGVTHVSVPAEHIEAEREATHA